MRIGNYNVFDMGPIIMGIWIFITASCYLQFGIEGLIVAITFGGILFIPILFVVWKFLGFYEKVKP